MKILLVSNNLVVQDISYNYDTTIEEKRVNRPLSIEGENFMEMIAPKLKFNNIYASNYASAIGSAKYVSRKNNNELIIIDKDLEDSIIGDPKKNNIQMLRFMQERNFDFKYQNGESINDTKLRMKKCIDRIIRDNKDTIIFTHKRSMLAYLLLYCEKGYNLDDRLILSYNNKVVLDDIDNDIDMVEITLEDMKIINVKRIEVSKL